jgi:hypothetical protein
MSQYVVVGTYPTGTKRAFVVIADNYSKAIQKMLQEEGDSFINVEVIDTFGSLSAIGAAAIMGNQKSVYQNVAEAMELIHRSMGEYEITEALDENGEPTDKFHARWNSYFTTLSEDGRNALLSLLVTAKGLVNIAELAGHDFL